MIIKLGSSKRDRCKLYPKIILRFKLEEIFHYGRFVSKMTETLPLS